MQYIANNFPFMYSQKRLSQASLLVSINYFIMIFCREVQYYMCIYKDCYHSTPLLYQPRRQVGISMGTSI